MPSLLSQELFAMQSSNMHILAPLLHLDRMLRPFAFSHLEVLTTHFSREAQNHHQEAL